MLRIPVLLGIAALVQACSGQDKPLEAGVRQIGFAAPAGSDLDQADRAGVAAQMEMAIAAELESGGRNRFIKKAHEGNTDLLISGRIIRLYVAKMWTEATPLGPRTSEPQAAEMIGIEFEYRIVDSATCETVAVGSIYGKSRRPFEVSSFEAGVEQAATDVARALLIELLVSPPTGKPRI